MSASVRSLSSGASDSEGGRSPSPPAGSPLSDTKRARAAEKARHKEEIKRVKAAQRKERTALIFRRDTLSYFDAARVVGPLVFVDTVPLVFNAVLVASLGNVVTFKDGGLRCVFPVLAAGSSPSIKYPCDCGVGLHMYLQGLVGISYVLLMYMTSVALGGHVTAHVNVPFIFVSLTLAGLLAWGFFFGLPVTLVLLSEIVAGSIRESKCFKEHPWLYGAIAPPHPAPAPRLFPHFYALSSRPCPHHHHPHSLFPSRVFLLQLRGGKGAPQVGRFFCL